MPPAYALALAGLITAPLLRPGYPLLRDAVSTPRSYLSDAALGGSEAAPRALPQDFAVALASWVVDGGVVVKVLLVAGLFLAGWGAARLVSVVAPDAGLAGQLVAVTVAMWNPYVAERLLQGHWSLLVGYGSLAWVAVAVLRLRAGAGEWWSQAAALAWWLALAGLTPTGLMLAAVVALAAVAAPGAGRPRWPCVAVTLVASTLAAMPWLVAAALTGALAATGQGAGPSMGVLAFAARAEPGLGTLGSLAGLAGIWNGQAVPGSRTTPFAIVGTVVLLGVVLLGLPAVRRRPAALPFLVLAVLAVVLPAAAATGPGLAALDAVLRAVPGLGVLRDGQKWVALAVPGYALCAGCAVVTLRPRLPAPVTGVMCCVAVLAVLPDLAWGVGGQLTAVRYPPGWARVTAAINADPRPVAVLPPDVMRQFDWAGRAPVLDPLPRWVSADVLATGDLTIGGRIVEGEGVRARGVQQLLLSGAGADELARAGVGWVVTEGGSGAPPAALGLPIAYRDADIALYRVGGDHPAAAHRGVLIAAHLVWLATLLGGAIGTAVGFARRLVVG